MMRIIDIPEFRDKKDVLCLEESKTVQEAVNAMAERHVGSCVVTTKTGKVKGIFTERDLLNKVIAKDKDPKKVLLKSLKAKNICVAHPDDNVMDSLRRMSQGRYRHLPVLDDDNHLLGIVSQGDFVALTWGKLAYQLKQETKMSFFSHTQLWMIVLGLLLYISVMIYLALGGAA